jgi:hypothetical protein
MSLNLILPIAGSIRPRPTWSAICLLVKALPAMRRDFSHDRRWCWFAQVVWLRCAVIQTITLKQANHLRAVPE